jgi:hypothetical protein
MTLSPAMVDRVQKYCDENKITRSQFMELAAERMLINEEARE